VSGYVTRSWREIRPGDGFLYAYLWQKANRRGATMLQVGFLSYNDKHMLGTVARPEQELLTDDGRCCAIGQEAALTAWNRVRILSSRALSGLWSSMRAQVDRSRRRS